MGRPSRREVFGSLDQAREDLLIIGGLPEPTVFQDVWADIWVEETHNSTAIEGNTLRQRQIQLLLEDNIISGSPHELKEWLEVKAYAEAARWTYQAAFGSQRKETVTEREIRQIHQLTVESVWAYFPPEGLRDDEKPGGYRTGDVQPLRSGLQPPPPSVVSALMGDWVKAVDSGIRPGCHVLEQLAELHADFERIHPFPDGNGRAGRLVLSLLLVRRGYPPAIVYKGERKQYLKTLEKADNGEPGPLGELLARSVRDGIYRFLMPSMAGPLSVVPLAGLADDSISQSALIAAAQRGRLRANKYQNHWYSTRQWVDEYKASRYSRKAPALF